MSDEPLLEKWRPRTLDEIIGQEAVITSIKGLLENINTFPHLFMSGPQGTGKTTTAEAIAYQIYGKNWRDIVLEINASNERKKEIVEGKIQTYCKTINPMGDYRKLIILDEFDAFGLIGQDALRRLMETYAANVIFIIVCNFSRKVIKPIRSRCAPMKFTRATEDDLLKYTIRVAKGEKIAIKEDAMHLIAINADGDHRQAIMMLQLATQKDKTGAKYVSTERILEVFKILTDEAVSKIMNLIIAGNIKEAVDITDMYLRSNILPETIIDALFGYCRKKEMFTKDDTGLELMSIFADTSVAINTTNIPEIVLTNFIMQLNHALNSEGE